MRKYSSYDGELSPAVPNVLKRTFKADRINEKWAQALFFLSFGQLLPV